jgi:nucleotide-binding universal stress UspA family protein
MATQGKGVLARMVLGSVTQQVLQSASIDVLTIPPVAGH